MTVSISSVACVCDKNNRQIIVWPIQYQTTHLTFFFFFKTDLTKLPNCSVFV